MSTPETRDEMLARLERLSRNELIVSSWDRAAIRWAVGEIREQGHGMAVYHANDVHASMFAPLPAARLEDAVVAAARIVHGAHNGMLGCVLCLSLDALDRARKEGGRA